MNQHAHINGHDGDPDDRPDAREGVEAPSSLPLFAATNHRPGPASNEVGTAASTSRPGRVRGTFSMHPGMPTHAGAIQMPATRPSHPVPNTVSDEQAQPQRGLGTGASTLDAHCNRPDWDGQAGAAVGPQWAPHAGGRGGELDWSLVAAFRSQASDQLTAALGTDWGRMTKAEQEQLGGSIIAELLEAAAAENLSEGAQPWTMVEQGAMAEAVFNALFRLGRLQPLVDDDQVENIIISGAGRVLLELVDGTLVPGPAVADSDQELIDFLVFVASRSEVNARPFSEAEPRLHLRLDGGARLAAAAWVTPWPSVVIRRNRLMEVTLEDLVARGALSPVAASFLRAAVRARKSIVVAGAQGSGKTTMVRALCAEIGRWEAIGTFETEYELHLHELPHRHPIVHAWEARPGSGERGPDGRRAGEFSLDEALYDSFRFNLSRQIVGEVRGKEIWAMIKAMESGAGSISTTHAANAESAIRKLVTCAMEAGSHVTAELATSKLAETVDLIVQLHLETTPNPDGTARHDRWVTEILAVTPGEREKGYATTQVFRPAAGRAAVPGILPDELRALERDGFDLGEYLHQGQLEEAT